jgi:hypothetical protein
MQMPRRKSKPEPNPALRLWQILRQEHDGVRPRSGSAAERSAREGARGPEDAAPVELMRVDELIARLKEVTGRTTAAPSARARAAGESTDRDLPYARLAEWVRHAPADVRSAVPDGRVAAPGTTVEPSPEPTAEDIEVVLNKMVESTDLPVEEPWIRDAALRPFTRGLLKRHMEQRRFIGKQPGPDRRLNRLLLEDVFAKHVRCAEDIRLREVFRDMRESGRAALCLSGGGIRSATFALGVVQGLARHGVLGKFSYLSTVSGGGYLGSWLSAWSRQEGLGKMIGKLEADRTGALAAEAAPVGHLRQYSNYLSPRLGLLSADTWTLAATLIRNLLLIWLVVVPLLAAVAALPWLAATLTVTRTLTPEAAADPGRAVLLAVMVAFAAVFVAFAIRFVHAHRPETEDDPPTAAAGAGPVEAPSAQPGQGEFLRQCLAPLALAVFLWSLAWYWFGAWKLTDPSAELLRAHPGFGPGWLTNGVLAMAAGGAVVHLAGWLGALRSRRVRRQRWRLVREALAIVLTGAAAGLLLLLPGRLAGVQGKPFAGGTIYFAGGTIYTVFAVPAILVVVLVAGFAFEGLMSRERADAEREWTARYSAWILIVAAGWLVLSGIILFGPTMVTGELKIAWGAGLGSGALAAWLGRSPKTGGEGEGAGKRSNTGKRDWSGMLARLTLPVAAILAAVLLVVGLSALNLVVFRWVCSWDWVEVCQIRNPGWKQEDLVTGVSARVVAMVAAAFLVLGWGFSRYVDTNRFSLHAMYRARLIRAYLGASRPAGERRPDPFTGFDEADNLHMGCLQDPAAGAAAADPADRPLFHVVNLALNLVAGRNLAWQERKAESFTVSPLHAGSMHLGYRRTHLPGQQCPAPAKDPEYYGGDRGITLGTAMTISGAAASPNMGYHSSPAITFIMTMFNARLGWWLGNPGPAGDRTFHKSAPTYAVRPILDEMLGRTTDTNEYVYLSDGGHFENLGLYEMVLRRNRFIVVSDASCDEQCTLQDLGNAIRKIRIDLGIPIEFDDRFSPRPRSGAPGASPGGYWALARIRYSCVDAAADVTKEARVEYDGVLLYVKPGIYGGEPRDVYNYAAANPAFPHESTADQFFSESQFESYRTLGSHAVDEMARHFGDLRPLFTESWWRTYLGSFPQTPGPAARQPGAG